MAPCVIVLRSDCGLDEAIQKLLSEADRPLSASTIAFLMDRPTRDVCMALNRLRKYREVAIVPVTARRLRFWQIRR